MNHLRRAVRGTALLVTRICTAVERIDASVEAALRARLRPLVTRLAVLLQRMAAANCSDALTRHLPCRTRDRSATADPSPLDD
ncbi:hypothetical protein ABT093_40130 [Kitasatospora sp. NPDC002551]|uniref:hypothetical protein n=1 Tax=unclassified Kitasatospora TaxID=2633591 RepID=UPI003332A9AD